MNKKLGLTLIEMLIICIIIGILATFAMPGYFKSKEKALDKDAQANLRLIIAAEKILRMETGSYGAYDNIPQINTGLHLDIPNPATPSWIYKTIAAAGTDTATAKAQRNGSDDRVWCMGNADEEAYTQGCSW